MHQCYLRAGEDTRESDACDLLYYDIKKLLWNELDFDEIVEFNHERYTFVNGRMDEHDFAHLMAEIRELKEALTELMDEMDAHKDILMVEIKSYIDRRTKAMMVMSDLYGHHMPKVKVYDFGIKQEIYNKDAARLFLKLPNEVRMDGTKNLFKKNKAFEQAIAQRPQHPDAGLYTGRHPRPMRYKWKKPQSELVKIHDKMVLEHHMGSIEANGDAAIKEEEEREEPKTFKSMTGYEVENEAMTDPNIKDSERGFHHKQGYMKPDVNGSYDHLNYFDNAKKMKKTRLKRRKLNAGGRHFAHRWRLRRGVISSHQLV